MEITHLRLLELAALGFFAGGLGALTGIGGGLVIVPVLTVYFRIPIHQAVGTSLCCVIATSSGAAASYVEHHLSDIRLGMTLELATTIGAVAGALVATRLPREALAILLAAFLSYSGAVMLRRSLKAQGAPRKQDSPGERRSPSVPDADPREACSEAVGPYTVKRLPLGLAGSGLAGMVSGMLGIGGGPIKVPMMYLAMGVPFKVATATSNFMIGVTAAASAFIYYSRGDVRLLTTAPTAIGVFGGAALGTRVMRRAQSRWLIRLFSLIMFYFAGLMIWRSAQGGFAR